MTNFYSLYFTKNILKTIICKNFFRQWLVNRQLVSVLNNYQTDNNMLHCSFTHDANLKTNFKKWPENLSKQVKKSSPDCW